MPFCRCKKSSTQKFNAVLPITQQVAKRRHSDSQSLVKGMEDLGSCGSIGTSLSTSVLSLMASVYIGIVNTPFFNPEN